MAKAFAGLGATVVDDVSDLPVAAAALEGMIVFQKDSNELKICDGTSWRTVLDTDIPMGLVMINPSSVSGAGTSLSNGVISLSGATGVIVEGVFSSSFANYLLVGDLISSLSVVNVNIRLRASGVDYSNNDQVYQYIYSTNAGGPFRSYGTINGMSAGAVGNLASNYDCKIFGPNKASAKVILATYGAYGNTSNETGFTATYSPSTTQFTGFNFYPNSGSLTGNLRLYGYRNSI